MLSVKTPEEAWSILEQAFPPRVEPELVPLEEALGRVLAEGVEGREYVPGFDRSAVDGYALRSADTFGCSDAIPAILPMAGTVAMGGGAGAPLPGGACAAVPTGGAVPAGADAVVMLEYTEDYGDGTIGVYKSVAPGENMVFRGDDVRPGKTVLPAGRLLLPQDIGALAALGVTRVPVCRRPVVGILSTGDELVGVDRTPGEGQVRDVNSALLRAMTAQAGGEPRCYGILADGEEALGQALDRMTEECDVVLLSGGSSVGEKDLACRVIAGRGEVLFHGVAMKPGKPTILGKVNGKPVFGLPGHPAAAFFAARLFAVPLLARYMGRTLRPFRVKARLTENVSANHGRAQYGGVTLTEREGVLYAAPIRSKSGLITALAGSDGWFCIPRDREGAAAGEEIEVTLYTAE